MGDTQQPDVRLRGVVKRFGPLKPWPASISMSRPVSSSHFLALGAATRIELEDGGRRHVATLPGAAKITAGDTVAYGWRDEDALILPMHED